MPLPDFLVIGAEKAGTTSLHAWLRQHPAVFMPRLKEPKFFAYDSRPGDVFRITTIEAYRALFDEVAGETAIGEASPQYLQSPIAPARIRELLPAARLIVSLRNPVDRARSLYEMKLRNRGRNANRSFREALLDDPLLQQGYHTALGRYLETFDREKIRVLLFEELVRDTPAAMRDLFVFLGVDPGFMPDTERAENPGGLPRSGLLHTIVNDRRLQEVGRWIVPEAARAPIRRLHRRVRESNLKKTDLSEADRVVARDCFREDILRTQDLLDFDLGHWLVA